MQGLLGRKIGMTSLFETDGRHVPVTVLEMGPCVVLQRKTTENDGYEAVQCGFGEQKECRVRKPRLGHFKKAGTTPKRLVRELAVGSDSDVKAGDTLTVSLFEGVEFVDVRGVTKGKGFQGVVRRYRMAGGPITHGGHAKRKPGSIGCASYPARVMKGKKMPGHMGAVQRVAQNLKVVRVMTEDNVLVVRGAVAGPAGGFVVVTTALKKKATNGK